MTTVNETFYRVYGMSWHTRNGAEPAMIWCNYGCQEILRENHLCRKESLISFGMNCAANVIHLSSHIKSLSQSQRSKTELASHCSSLVKTERMGHSGKMNQSSTCMIFRATREVGASVTEHLLSIGLRVLGK